MIDLRSDTLTRPTEAMRRAVLDAEVGDEKRDGDPTVRRLESRVAAALGFEAGVYVPSGTMANQIAARVLTTPGQEVVLDRWTHAYTSEHAGLAQLAQLQIRTVDGGEDGCPSPATLEAAFQERTQPPGTGLVLLENTHNKRGGRVVAPSAIEAAAGTAHERGIPVHLDGARLANAAVALDEDLASFTAPVDAAMFDLSKGLGAPIGSVLCGDDAFVEEARYHRDVLGGGWRQAGVVAAMGLVALDDMDRLAEDHDNAAALAEGLSRETTLDVLEPATNLVLVDTEPTGLSAAEFVDRCEAAGVRVGATGPTSVRCCLYRGIDRDDVETAVERIADALA